MLIIMSFLFSKQEAEALETELLEDYRFGKQQLIEILGHSCAMAVTKVCMVRGILSHIVTALCGVNVRTPRGAQ